MKRRSCFVSASCRKRNVDKTLTSFNQLRSINIYKNIVSLVTLSMNPIFTIHYKCHEFSLCGSDRHQRERHLSINRHELPLFPAPVADHRHRCFSLTLVHLSCFPCHLCKVLSCLHSRVFTPCMTWTVYWTLIQPALLSDYPECSPPALILHPNSDFDSALSTLYLKPLI